MKKSVILIRNAKSYDFGGGERFPVFLADILKREKWTPIIVSRSSKLLAFAADHSIETVHGWWWSHQQWSGKQAILFPVYIFWQLALFVWYLLLFIRLGPEAIHIQSKDDFIAASFAGKLLGKQVIWTDHADLKHIWMNLEVWYKNPIGKLVFLATFCADTITVVSQSEYNFVSKLLPKKGGVLSKIRIIYNGVTDSRDLYPPRLYSDDFIFCTANRLVTDKGIGEVLNAFIQLEKKHKHISLHLLGDGPEAATFKTVAKKHSHIQFLGHQKNPLSYIAQCDVFIQPSYHEGFSVALVEASMLERPIITTRVGGNVEIIRTGETGILVEPKNTKELENAMALLLQNTSLRKKLGENARREYEKRFNFKNITVNEFIPLYEGGKL